MTPSQKFMFRMSGRLVISLLMVVGAIIGGWIGAVSAFFGAAIFLNSGVGLLLLAFFVGLSLSTGLAWLAAGLMKSVQRRTIALGVGAATMLVLASISWLTIFQPLALETRVQGVPVLPAPVRFWDLPTGSHIAYLKIPARGPAKPMPIVLVHGGPGGYEVTFTPETTFFSRFAQLGYEIYFYDQIGSGLSARLDDPTYYTVARHVADLEAIRQKIGVPKLILMGESWGGTLVANYLAAYPHRVDRAVFTSPGAINDAEWSDEGNITDRFSPQEQQRINALLSRPRFLFWDLLGQINPQAAHSLVPDREVDAFFDVLLQRTLKGGVCDPAHLRLPEGGVHGGGLYANIWTDRSSHTIRSGVNPRLQLASNFTPALILTGSCNYTKWAVTSQYKTTLPNSTLLYVPHAGHIIYMDQPDLYFACIRAFLLNEPWPLRPWTSASPPGQ